MAKLTILTGYPGKTTYAMEHRKEKNAVVTGNFDSALSFLYEGWDVILDPDVPFDIEVVQVGPGTEHWRD